MRNIKQNTTALNATLNRAHKRNKLKLLVVSNFVIASNAFFWFTPAQVDAYRADAEAHAFAAAVVQNYHLAMAEDARASQEDEVMKQYLCLATTLYWEAERTNATDHQAIADVIFSRVASGRYPDTICEVINEVRQNSDGDDVAMFSYIFDIAGKPAPSGTAWKFSRRQAAIAYKDHLDGKAPSGNLNYLADYVHPKWRYTDVEECKLRVVDIPGSFHIFFAPVEASARPACLASRKQMQVAAATASKAKAKAPALNVPVPQPRPKQARKQDDVASLILAKN